MANSRVCSIPDCGKPHRARGWCATHWSTWRRSGHATPLPKTSSAEIVAFIDRAFSSQTDACIMWPYAFTGRTQDRYGVFTVGGRDFRPHRVICEKTHGPPPAEKPFACHACGNKLCINPRHLRWGSPADNSDDAKQADATPFGERNANAKITDQQAREIFLSLESHGKLARRYGITRTAAQQIQRRQTWVRATKDLVAPEGRLKKGARWPTDHRPQPTGSRC